MDFLKLLQSLEELLFEVLTWLIYYPRTMWLVLRDPLGMIRYSDHEQQDDAPNRYSDTLSPPFLLLLTVALVHGLELAADRPALRPETEAMRRLFESDQNLIVARSLLFGSLPLMAALRFVRARGLPLERRHLRAPFFGQCYLVAPYALAISVASALASTGLPASGPAGALAAVVATAWYLLLQTLQFRRAIPTGPARALGLSLWAYGSAVVHVLAFGLLLNGGI